jgi:HD-GYP domain-containing protein (c-di-GMP phosphodiesterase class II)
MNVLVFHPQKDILEMIAFCLESNLSLTVRQADSFHKLVDHFIEDASVDLVIATQHPDTDKLFKYILSTNASTPFILVGTDLKEKITAYPDIKVIGQLQEPEIPHKLMEVITCNFSMAPTKTTDDEFCRIQTELLLRVSPLKGDVYIRLSNVKYVKLFLSGANFTKDDYEKYLVKRKVNYLYIKKLETQEFIQKLSTDLSDLLSKTPNEAPETLETVADFQEAVFALSERLGFTKEVQDLAKKNVKLTLAAIGKSNKLSKVISGSKLKSKNYLSRHSIMLANMSCSIAAQMEWPSNTTFEKLVMAALFHDVYFQDLELAKISTKEDLESLRPKLTEEQFEAVKSHGIKASELLKSMNEVPSDVDVIVLQHHERPDGSGFPRGIHASQIAPLSAVMIVAHDIINAIEAEGETFDLKAFLKKTESIYTSGSFKKTWRALNNSQNGEGHNDFPESA